MKKQTNSDSRAEAKMKLRTIITKMRMFEIFITISLASYILVCRTLAQQYDNFDCKTVNEDCPTAICESYSNKKSILPVDSIPRNICSLTISSFGNGSLVITREDTFHKFENLQNLTIRLTRSLQLAENFSDSAGKEYLNKVLFDIPKLNRLSVEYEEFNSQYNFWMLPESVIELHLSNGLFEFDLRYCSKLTSLRLNNNDLRKIPQLHDPLPPLETLDLRNNPLDEFTVNDIASFCELKYFAMDAIGIDGCECTRLKQWKMKSNEWADFTFEGNINCEDSADSADCTLEEAMQTREKCSPNTAGFPISLAKWEWKDTALMVLFFAMIMGCYICSCLIYFFYSRVLGDPESRMRRQAPRPGPGGFVYPGAPGIGNYPGPNPYGSPY